MICRRHILSMRPHWGNDRTGGSPGYAMGTAQNMKSRRPELARGRSRRAQVQVWKWRNLDGSGKKRRSAATVAEPVSLVAVYRERIVDWKTVDLGTELMHEMEEVKRIASTSRNLKGTYSYTVDIKDCGKCPVRLERLALSFSIVRLPPSGLHPAAERQREREKEEEERGESVLPRKWGDVDGAKVDLPCQRGWRS